MAHRLLLADDSITIQKVVELVLAEEDFQIKSVSNGEDAYNLLQTFSPDIVLADIEMPKMNGYKLCEKIKQNPDTAGIPVLLLAGAFEPIDEELARKVGADDSIIKPFESQELVSKINAALTLGAAGGGMGPEGAFGGEEGVEVLDVLDAGLEAEAVAELGEDLWTMEDIETPLGAEPFPEEAAAVEPSRIGEETSWAAEPVRGEEMPRPDRGRVAEAIPSVAKEELVEIIEKAVRERIDAHISELDMKAIFSSALAPSMKDTVEKVLWEVAPDLIDKLLKEIVNSSLGSLTKEIEKVMWETVPDLANTVITKEIEKIRSEF